MADFTKAELLKIYVAMAMQCDRGLELGTEVSPLYHSTMAKVREYLLKPDSPYIAGGGGGSIGGIGSIGNFTTTPTGNC